MRFGHIGSAPRGHAIKHHRGRVHHPQIPAMARFPFHLFEHFPPRFITMEELFAHLPLVQRGHQRLNEHRDALQPIGERALGQRQAVMPQLFTEAMRGTAIEIFVQQHPRPDRYSQRAFRDHTRRGRCCHNAFAVLAAARLVVARTLDASNMGLDLHFDDVRLFGAWKRCKGRATCGAVLRRLAQVMHFGHDREGGTVTAAVPLAAKLLTTRAGIGRLGAASLVRTYGLLAFGAVQTLVEVADHGLKRFHLRLQGRFALERLLMLRSPVLGLPLELDIGLLRQHYTLLRKRSSVVAVARRQIRDGVDIGGSALHGERYTRFFWNVLVFYDGSTGFAETLPLYGVKFLTLPMLDWRVWSAGAFGVA